MGSAKRRELVARRSTETSSDAASGVAPCPSGGPLTGMLKRRAVSCSSPSISPPAGADKGGRGAEDERGVGGEGDRCAAPVSGQSARLGACSAFASPFLGGGSTAENQDQASPPATAQTTATAAPAFVTGTRSAART
jgi:hypothetical protein